MKFTHYIYKYETFGGKSLFVNELSDNNENILTFENNTSDNRVIDINSIEKIQHIESDYLILHDIKGLNLEYMDEFKKHFKSIIFIVHDYYPICERYTLINNKNGLCPGPYGNNCIYCYIDKFPIIKDFGRNTQQILIPIIKTFSKSMQYYFRRFSKQYEIIMLIDKIIFPTQRSLKIMMRFFKQYKNVIVLPHFQLPIDCNSIKREKPIFAFIGHEEYHKGYYFLEEALSTLTTRGIKIKVFGNISTILKKDNRIEYKGNYDLNNINNIFSQFDVLIFPSLWPETWGRVMSEAAICGKYIIASNITPADEVLKDYKGYTIYSHNSEKQLAKAIYSTYKNWKKINYPFNKAVFLSRQDYRQKLLNLFNSNN